jgi:hypothetical protein
MQFVLRLSSAYGGENTVDTDLYEKVMIKLKGVKQKEME